MESVLFCSMDRTSQAIDNEREKAQAIWSRLRNNESETLRKLREGSMDRWEISKKDVTEEKNIQVVNE